MRQSVHFGQAGWGVVRSSAGVTRTSGLALALLVVTAVIELLVVAFASAGFEEVSDASAFGPPGTTVAAGVIAVVALLATVVAWRGVTGVVRGITATVVFAAAGIIAVMALFFLIAGGTPIILAVLLAHAAFSVAMIGRAVLRSAPTGTGQ
jgi:choline-glycine betaine transporter